MDKAHKLYMLNDATCDMLKGLNVLTDCEKPTFCEVQMMGILSKAVKDLEKAAAIVAGMPDMDMPEEAMAHKVK